MRKMTDQPPQRRKRHARSPTEGQRFCRVCGDLAATFNFGQICCESCKAFFRRNVDRQLDSCRCEGNCLVTVATRRNCRACRLDKCLSVGMRLEQPGTVSSTTALSDASSGSPAAGQDSQCSSDGIGHSAASPTTWDAEQQQPQQQQNSPLNWQDAISQIADCCDGCVTDGASGSVEDPGNDHNHNQRCPSLTFEFNADCSLTTRRNQESEFIGQVTSWLVECVDCDLAVPTDLRHDLRRGLGEQLDSWQDMISQLEIFMQPVIRFCRLFFKSALVAETAPEWRQEFSVRLVKLRLHTMLVPMFSTKVVAGSAGQLQVSIAGTLYSVDPNKSISQLDRSFAPGLSALTANDRYFAYIQRVIESRPTLIGLYSLLKLLDLSDFDSSSREQDLADNCRRLFVRVSACLRRAFADELVDTWRDKLRELAILFEWSKTFDASLQALFNGLGEHSPSALFSEIYSGGTD